MKNLTKKVVVLNHLSCPYIHQAILFLNENESISEDRIVLEAEQIVNEYLQKSCAPARRKASSFFTRKPRLASIAVFALSALVLFALCFFGK
jgi:hypothetical protein